MVRVIFVMLLGMPTLAAAAGPTAIPPPGATSCSGCHGSTGGSGFKPILGRDAADLSTSMEAFRSGERPSTVMGRLMKGFSHDEIQAIAAWTAAQK